MNKKIIAMSTVVLMGIASLVSCNQTSNNQKEEQSGTELVQNDTIVKEDETATAENTNPTVREVLQNGAKTKVDYNFMDAEFEITMVYNGEKYSIYSSQLTDEARSRIEDIFCSAAEEPIKTIKPSDVKPEVRISDIYKY